MNKLINFNYVKGLFASNKKHRFDMLFALLVTLIVFYGTLMVFSAGVAYAEARYNDSLYFIKKQTVWLLLGFLVMYISSRIDPRLYQKYTPHFYALTLFLLILVLAVGFVGNGAQRWISIGPLTIQPSEIAKLSIVMMLAYYFTLWLPGSCVNGQPTASSWTCLSSGSCNIHLLLTFPQFFRQLLHQCPPVQPMFFHC